MLQFKFSSCDDDRLRHLLYGRETGGQFRETAKHVESCSRCQTRLGELAAESDEWAEARAILSDVELPVDALGDSSKHGSECESGAAPVAWDSDPEPAPHGNPELREPARDGNPKLRRGRDTAGFDEVASVAVDFLDPPSHPEMLGRLGRYEIERVIGAGGMGIVLKAHDTELNRPVAIKVLAPHMSHNGAARQRFAREARAAAAVVHEHVVSIHNVESDARVPFLVMQYVPGRSLQARVEEDGPLEIRETLRIGIQAASGLAAAHAQGLVHRDIKPANMLLENGVERVLLSDFGLARAADDASLTQTGIVAGTPHYMSPEQAAGNPVDHRSDLFSLGAVLYFMCSGHPPFRAERAMAVLHRICHDRHRPIWQVNPDVPDDLADLIDRLLEKSPARRLANATTVQRRLEGLLVGMQTEPARRRRWFRRWSAALSFHSVAHRDSWQGERASRATTFGLGTLGAAVFIGALGLSAWRDRAKVPDALAERGSTGETAAGRDGARGSETDEARLASQQPPTRRADENPHLATLRRQPDPGMEISQLALRLRFIEQSEVADWSRFAEPRDAIWRAELFGLQRQLSLLERVSSHERSKGETK